MRNKWFCLLLLSLSFSLSFASGPYEPNWESLSKHYQTPEWFKDAKLGIYTHWGPVTVGSETVGIGGVQWYGQHMYNKIEKPVEINKEDMVFEAHLDDALFEAHKAHFGDQKEFGYKDIIPLFKAEKFDADQWADIFAASGAKFAGPVAIHHDNFAMWDSKVNPWNSMDKGPGRDITGQLEKAIKARGMKFITTFHHAYAWGYYRYSYNYDAADEKNIELYGEVHKEGEKPTQRYLDAWLGMVNEVVTKYEPDLIWFDFGLRKCITPEYRKKMFADYYNWAAAKGKQVGIAHKHWDIHKHTGIIDFERGRLDKKTDYAWLTDTAVGPWFHVKNADYKSVNQLVDVLVDIVSKNGCMLLNVDPKMDGTIPEESKQRLLGLGQWLKVNGQAIYATRTFDIYGEGPSKMKKSGGFSERKAVQYTAQDIRFTQSKDGKTVYTIVLDWPTESITIQSLKVDSSQDSNVEMLGSKEKIDFSIDNQKHLKIKMPKKAPCEHAFAFKLTGFDLTPTVTGGESKVKK